MRIPWPVRVMVALWAAHVAHDAVWLAADIRPVKDDFHHHYRNCLRSSFYLEHADRVLVSSPDSVRDAANRFDEEHPLASHAANAPVAGVVALAQQIHVSGSYPPLGYLVAAPALVAFGRHPDVAAFAIDAAFAALLFWGLYILGKTYRNPWAGVLAAFLAACYPWLGGLSRFLLLDVPLAATVTLAAAFLAASGSFSNRRGSIGFGLAAGLALLTKQIAPVFLAGPFLLAAWPVWRARRGPAGRSPWRNLLVALAIASAVAAPYYVPRLPGLVSHFSKIEEGGGVENDPGPTEAVSYIFYPAYLAEQMGMVGLALAALGIPFFAARFRNFSGLFLLAWIVVPYLFFSVFPNKDLRYTVPYLPAFAFVTAAGLLAIPGRALRAALVAGSVASMGFLFAHASWRLDWRWLAGDDGRVREIVVVEDPDRGVRIAIRWPVDSEFAPASEDWKTREMRELLETRGRPRGKVGVWVLGFVGEILHAIQGEEEIRRNEYRFGLAAGFFDVSSRWRPDAAYVLAPSAHWGNVGSRPILDENLRRFAEVESEFEELGTIELPHGLSVRVLARRRA